MTFAVLNDFGDALTWDGNVTSDAGAAETFQSESGATAFLQYANSVTDTFGFYVCRVERLKNGYWVPVDA